ncbi:MULTISPECIES: AAA family ATPase [Methylobacter]
MYIKQLILNNFRSFTDLTIPFVDEEHGDQPSKTVVFIGNNGAGKTAILDALKTNLSWLVARINRINSNGSPIAEKDIHNGQAFAAISLQLQYQDKCYNWRVAKTLRGRTKTIESQLQDVTRWILSLQDQLSLDATNTSLPLIAYYPVERAVLDIPLKINTRHSFDQLDGYDNALQGVDFRRFFEWFRDREDSENEVQIQKTSKILDKLRKSYPSQYSSFDDYISSLYGEDALDILLQLDLNTVDQIQASTKDRQLTAVRVAIKTFMGDFNNLRIQRKPRLQMFVDKNGKTLDVAQLSQGEKSMMALVGDIARRLAMMNPALENPLKGFGIVLIDEVDLHLHPNWQRVIVGNLNKTFPNCQFVLTTHSPIVISESPNLLCYSLNDGELQKLNNLYGMDVNQVLLQDMDAGIRNADIQQDFDNLRDSLQDGQLADAKELLTKLEKQISIDNLELSKAKLLIRRLEVQRAANH